MRSLVTFKTEAQHRGAVLRVMCLALMMVVAAVASLNVALPDLARDTGATQSELQWIVDAYAMVFAGLLLPAGAIGDRFGRKRILLDRARRSSAPPSLVGASSSIDPATLIGLRAAMGVGAALVMPTTLSIITTVFPPEERGQAVGVWVGRRRRRRGIGLLLSGAAARVLLLALGLRAQRGARRAVARRRRSPIVPTSRSPTAVRLDPIGALLSLVGARGARVRDHRGAGARLGRSGDDAGLAARRLLRSRSCSGSSTGASRCSTRACSAGAASAPARCR